MTSPRYTTVGTLNIHRLMVGMWQVSSTAWGRYPDPSVMVNEMQRYLAAGFTTFDMADHYGDAELLYSKFYQAAGSAQPGPIGCTKWCPSPGKMTRQIVETAIRTRCTRMGVKSLDMLQFHWWDLEMKQELMDALSIMNDLRKEGLIKNLALTNFDTEHVKKFVEAGIPIVSNQVQFSIIDLRPTVKMGPFCEQHGIKLLCYGTLCGGFLSNKFLGEQDATRFSLSPSQRKYKQMIDLWGGWSLFQDLLGVLDGIAKRKENGVDISNVATRYILDKPYVGAVIVGARLGLSEHIAQNLKTFDFSLDAKDNAEIEAILKRSNSERMLAKVGDCGGEYRG